MTKRYKNYFIMFLLYFLAYGFILINDGVYWDDWRLLVEKGAYEITRNTGFFLIWPFYIHKFCFSFLNGALIERFLIFGSFFSAGIFLDLILKKIKNISDTDRFYIVLFFLLFPINCARVAVCTIQYSISFFLFYFAFWVFAVYLEKKSAILRIISLFLFFISFSTNSLLIFYLLVFVYLLYKEKIYLNFIKIFKYTDFLVIPIIFFTLKKIFYPIRGMYLLKKYNFFDIKSILLSPILFLKAFYISFLKLIYSALFYEKFVLLLGFILFICYLMLKYKNYVKIISKNLIFVLWGFLFSFIAIFPYFAVGRMPYNFYFSSRHQLLFGLGFSFILFYAIKYFVEDFFRFNKRVSKYIYAYIIFSFIFYNIKLYSNWYKETLKNKSIMLNMKNSDIVRNNETFMIDDISDKHMAYRKPFYEYTCMFRTVFGDEKRLAFNKNEYVYKKIDYYERFPKSDAYAMKDYKLEEPDYIILIDNGTNTIKNNKLFLETLFVRFFHPELFEEKIKTIVNFKYKKLKSLINENT